MRPELDSAGAVRFDRPMRESPNFSGRKEAERAARQARLAAALRDNLRRRKEQRRAQEANREPPGEIPADLSGLALSSKSGHRGAGSNE
jgi:hypothetical protein